MFLRNTTNQNLKFPRRCCVKRKLVLKGIGIYEKHFDNYINDELNKLFRNQYFLDEFCLPELKLGTLCFWNSKIVNTPSIPNKESLLQKFWSKLIKSIEFKAKPSFWGSNFFLKLSAVTPHSWDDSEQNCWLFTLTKPCFD